MEVLLALQQTLNSLGEGTILCLFSGNSKICTKYAEDAQEILLLMKTPVSMSQSFMWKSKKFHIHLS